MLRYIFIVLVRAVCSTCPAHAVLTREILIPRQSKRIQPNMVIVNFFHNNIAKKTDNYLALNTCNFTVLVLSLSQSIFRQLFSMKNPLKPHSILPAQQ